MSAAAAPSTQRDRILDTALDLMAEHGASATSMRQLATACNLNVAALYHYFPSKAELLRSVIEERRYGLRLREVPEVDPALPPRERMVALVLAMWDGVSEEEAIWRLLLGEALRGDETAAAVGHEILTVLQPALRDWIVTLFPADGGGTPIDADAVATVLLGQVFSFFINQLFRPVDQRDAAARRDAEALVALVIR
ncbi:MAG: TetR/AcrR family transcriptional regulator [Acidimicrobiia bacterium]